MPTPLRSGARFCEDLSARPQILRHTRSVPEPLDATDRAIVRELLVDGRISLTELAGRVHLGLSATRSRVRRLEQIGVLVGYHAHVSGDAVGLPIRAVIRLFVHGALYDEADQVLARLPQVVRCLRVSGEACYLLDVWAASVTELGSVEQALATTGTVATDIVYDVVLERPPAIS